MVGKIPVIYSWEEKNENKADQSASGCLPAGVNFVWLPNCRSNDPTITHSVATHQHV
jgi:hypothetical protein